MSFVQNRSCEVCGKPAVEKYSIKAGDDIEASYYCSIECKKKNTWRSKIIVGAVGAIIGLSLLSGAAWPVGLIIIGGSGYLAYIGYNDSKL